MNAAVVAAFGLICFALAYRFYGGFLARTVYQTEDPDFVTPAHELEDGSDYVPCPSEVLWGHHFTSIAGLAPLVGPAVAVIWGWVPAVLWVVLGTTFIGAVHDYGCLTISAKNGGRSIADLTGGVLGKRARALFLTLVFFLTWIVVAVFAFIIALLFKLYPATVLPVNFEIVVALAIGWWVKKKQGSLLVPSLLALVTLYFLVWVGTWPGWALHMPAVFGDEIQTWLVFLLTYAFLASIMPVWLLLQPRDYINSHQLVVGLGGLYLSLFLFQPEIVAPAYVSAPAGAKSWFPFLFITIACGAISGFHGLVGSGTTSKQLDKLPSARPIGYGGMLGEGSVALLATLACTAGFRSTDAWSHHYSDWNAAAGLPAKLKALVSGGAYFLEGGLGVPEAIGSAIVAVLIISFGATTLDSATRIQRYIIQELAEGAGVSFLAKPIPAAAVAAFTPILLLMGARWKSLWPIFGASNQLLASMSLVVLTVYLARRGRPLLPVAAPMVYVGAITLGALGMQTAGFFKAGDSLLGGLSVLMFVLGAWTILEGALALRRVRAGEGGDDGLV